jgi:hopene-associated glycosyltransferase HpnB
VTLTLALVATGAASLAAWLAVLVAPLRPWDLRPIAEDEPPPQPPTAWPSVRVLVPARNEARYLPRTLPALLGQDYEGDWGVVLVDDRSHDRTSSIARALAGDHLTALEGDPLPADWLGKVWALDQGRQAAGLPDYFLLTDADILHAPGSLRQLIAESEANDLVLSSRMARLRASTAPERLLIPPFLFFFNLLYPMRVVNDPRKRLAAAAGGCVLVERGALERTGGFAAIRGEVIDDVSLARRVKRAGGRIRLMVSRSDVVSLREYGSIAAVWRMVRRSAFDQLGYSWLLLAGTVLALALLFAVPPALFLLAAAGYESGGWHVAIGSLGGAAWLLMAALFAPTVRYFGLPRGWALTLPVAGLMFGAMTVDSALRHAFRRPQRWS